MNFFENELRNLFEGDVVFDCTAFVGRVCLGDVGKDLRARVEFTCPDKFNRYSALQVTIMNRTSGVVDAMEIALRDVLGVAPSQGSAQPRGEAPHIWFCDGKERWIPDVPSADDYLNIRRAVRDYVDIFRSREERQERVFGDEKNFNMAHSGARPSLATRVSAAEHEQRSRIGGTQIESEAQRPSPIR